MITEEKDSIVTMQTDREIKSNWPDIVVKDYKRKNLPSYLLLPNDNNISIKEYNKMIQGFGNRNWKNVAPYNYRRSSNCKSTGYNQERNGQIHYNLAVPVYMK